MDYLCLAVKKEATRSQTGSREQAQKRFFEKFGDCVKVKLEEEKKKLEGRIRYYDRKGENSKGKPEEKEEWLRRREAAQREMECVERPHPPPHLSAMPSLCCPVGLELK